MEELEGIVQRMIDAGEPEENIKLVIEEFTSREKNKEVDLGKPEAVQDAAPVTAEEEAVDTESILEDGLLDFPIEGSLSLDNELQPEYLINDKKVKRSDLNDKLYDSDFIEGLQDGKINVSVKNDPKIMDLLERQANSGSQWGDKIEAFNSGLATLASGITGVQSYIEDVITEITGLEPTGMALLQKGARDQVSESLAKKAEELSNQQRLYKEDFIGSVSEGNISDAVNIGFNTVANSAPMMVAAGLTGGAGGVAGSLTSAATMSGIMIPAEYASTKISEDEKIKELSDGDKLTRAFFRGGAEGVFEGLMGPVGSRSFSLFKDGVKNLVKTAAKESGADVAKEVAEGIGKKTALEVFKTFGISTAGEAGSEALTSLSQDLTDDYLGIQDLSVEEYMRNAAEAGALGIFMGGVTTGALGGAGQVMSYLPLRNQKVYQGAKTKVREKQESGEINNEEAKQMDDAIESAKVALDKTDPSLSEDNQEQVAKLIDEREKIKLEIEGLDDNQVPVQNKKNRIDEINKEISEIGIEKPSTEEETGVPPTPEEPVIAETAPAEVEKLRAEEQAEMLEQIPGAENALTDGKVDREKIATEEGKAKFDEIYSKYDEKISPLLETAPVEERAEISQEVEKVAKIAGVKAKNIRGLYDINRKMFGQNRVKSLASAVVMDRTIGQMAKREGVPKSEMYGKIQFKKGEENLPQGVKFQLDAWHGSPYQFDKFTTEAIGTGEGAQAFGWGLYFTDIESIAQNYAEKLGGSGLYINGGEINKKLNFEKYTAAYDIASLGYERALERQLELKNDNFYDENTSNKIIENIKSLKDSTVEFKKKGVQYKVSLHKGKTPDQYTWLEWDKPLSDSHINKIASQAKKEGIYLNVDLIKKNKPNGNDIYRELGVAIAKNKGVVFEKTIDFKSIADKEASLFLLDAGIDGIKYPAESISRGVTSDTARGFNYVVFDENAVSIEEVIKFQRDAVKARGAAMVNMDGAAIIYALTDPNVSTPLHELAHVYEHYLTDAERKQILNWAGKKEWDVETSEKFARGFEKYLAEGKAPNSKLQKIFDKFKEWLTDIYNGIKGSDIDIELNDKMRSIYDQMLSEEQPKEAARKKSAKPKPKKKARSVASETTGLSPREAFKQGFTEFFDSIQRGKKEARQKAADNLKEKVNKIRESFKKRLQKEKDNKAARAAVVKEIRAIIKDSGISQFSKRTINKIMTNVKNTNANNMQRMVDEVMDVVNRDIDRKVRTARYKTLNAAIKKLSRLGALKELQKPLMGVLSINPDYLSKTALNFYDRVVINLANVEKKFDSRDSRDNLKNDAEKVIRSFTEDNSKAEELAQKTINPNLDLTKTKGENLKQMLKDGLISDSDFELMTRFEDIIGNTSKEKLTMEELEQKAKERREVAIEDFEAAMDEIPSSLQNLSRDDAEALRFANGLKMKDLDSLSTAQIKILTRGLEMLQAGFITTNLVQSKLTVEAKRNTTDVLINEVKERGKIDKAISSSKVFVQNLFRKRDKMITSIENRIKSTPLANIDQVLNAGAKKFKSTRIYESIFRPVGAAFSRTEDFLNQVKKKLQVAESYLNLNGNKRYVQKAKVMIYQIQREFESQPLNNEVKEAIEWIKATLNDSKTNLSDVERKAIEKIRDEFTVNGQIDSKKILDSLTDKEKKYMAIIDEVYKSVEFMVAADAKMQGKPFVLRENYVHLPKVTKSGNSMSSELDEISNSFTNPALKNKALTQRTGNAHAISFDPTFNVNGITKKAAISYYMYPAVKKAKITLAGVKQNADTDFQKETADALESVFDGIVKSQYAHLSSEKAFIEKALAFLGRAGYLAQLAGPVKAAVELGTNLTHALFVNPTGLISGFDTLSGNSREIMDTAINNLPTNQLNRLSGEGVKDSKEIDSRLINDSLNVFEQEEMTSEFRAKVNTIFKFAKKPASAIIKFNESLISRPDTIVARPLFVGVFNKSFENIAQEKPNWDKIANDQAYRDKFRDAINQATEDADTAVVDNAASNNPFDGIPKNVLDKDATAVKQALQMMDRYMTRFRTFEYYSALKGIQGLMGKGKLTPTQGAMLLAGTVVRLSLYKMGIDMVFTLIFSMLGIDEEEDEIDLEKDLTRGVIGAIATLALGRSIGNISQMPINFGTEWLNKEYGEGITRSGEYNQYKDGIVFSKIPMEVKPQDNMAEKILTSSLGSYTPVVKTATRAGKLATRAATSKGEDTRERNFGELTTRIPFEVAGNLGVVPGYKTLRKIYLKYLFGGVEKSKKDSTSESERRDTRRDTRRSSSRRRSSKRSSRRN